MDGINSLYLVLLPISLGFAAFFCSAETAFIGIQKLRLQHLIEKGNPRAKIVAKIMERPEKFLATVLLGINFFETAVATLGTIIAVSLWGENLGAALATIIITLGTLVLAEYIPKSLAARHGEKIALSYARPIVLISTIFYPFVYLLNHIGIKFSTLSEEGNPMPTVSEEEFRTMISVGHREGTVEAAEAKLLHNVFDFGDRPVNEVMIPRPEVIAIEKGATIGDYLSLFSQHPVSRFPVFAENMDNVLGTISIKDVLMGLAKGTVEKQSPIDPLIRPTYFAPATKRINELFAEMQTKNYHLAVIVDEYGGTAGIVSLSVLIEEIVGPVGDELAAAGKDYEVINEHTFQIDGSMRIEEVNKEMGLDLPDGNGTYETVAGFILSLLGHIPKQGEQLRYKSLKLVITRMRDKKIEEILVTKEKREADATAAR